MASVPLAVETLYARATNANSGSKSITAIEQGGASVLYKVYAHD